jgi:ribosome-binding factor A
MSAIKQKRTATQLQILLSELLREAVDDPRLAGVTVTEVRLDREMEHATVFVAALAGDEVRDRVLAGLTSAQGFLRREIGGRVRMRRTPVLHFHWDAGLERGERVARLLEELHVSDASAPPGAPQGAGEAPDAAEGDARDGDAPDAGHFNDSDAESDG